MLFFDIGFQKVLPLNRFAGKCLLSNFAQDGSHTVLYRTCTTLVQQYTYVLYCTVQYTVQYSTVYTMYTVQYCILTAQSECLQSIILYSTVRTYRVIWSTVQYSTVHRLSYTQSRPPTQGLRRGVSPWLHSGHNNKAYSLVFLFHLN